MLQFDITERNVCLACVLRLQILLLLHPNVLQLYMVVLVNLDIDQVNSHFYIKFCLILVCFLLCLCHVYQIMWFYSLRRNSTPSVHVLLPFIQQSLVVF
jgi:hypothetical protein